MRRVDAFFIFIGTKCVNLGFCFHKFDEFAYNLQYNTSNAEKPINIAESINTAEQTKIRVKIQQ